MEAYDPCEHTPEPDHGRTGTPGAFRMSTALANASGNAVGLQSLFTLGLKTKRYILRFQGLSRGTPPTAGPSQKRLPLDYFPRIQDLRTSARRRLPGIRT